MRLNLRSLPIQPLGKVEPNPFFFTKSYGVVESGAKLLPYQLFHEVVLLHFFKSGFSKRIIGMSNQIFKKNVPNELVFGILETICMKNEKYYIFDSISYKKGIYNGSIVEFIDFCKPYYHNSKKKYLERKLSYNNFITILRQICNCNNITYTSQIKYENSAYEIVYYIIHF